MPLIVFCDVWKDKIFWYFIKGQRFEPHRLEEARIAARENGYTGIKVRHPGLN